MRATLRTQLEAFENGIILDSDGKSSRCFNFYDWFCKEKSLQNKSIKLFGQVKKFLKFHPEIDLDTHYVFFKNNCPVFGSLYDDFRICDIESGNVIYTVTPKCGHRSSNGQAEVWGRANGFKEPIQVAKTFSKLFL